jgi:hypothetical protein
MTNTDAVEMLDRHIKENTANGNVHPGENWYERDYRDAEDMIVRFSDLNWQGLKNIFGDRSHIWQEACVFVLGEASTQGCISMLGEIFVRGTDGIACYAAIFISQEDLSKLSDSEQQQIGLRVHELLNEDLYKNYGEHYHVSLEKISEILGQEQR